MKNIIISGMMLIVAGGYAYADPIKMTLEKAVTLETALANGMTEAAGPGQPGKAYKLSAEASYAFAIDVSHLEPAVKAYQAALKAKTEELKSKRPEDVLTPSSASVSPFKPGSDAEKQLSTEMQSLWEKEQEFDLMTVNLKDLNIGIDPDKNHIPVNVMIAIAPIIKN